MTREVLLLLPGMMCDARLFAPQIAALQDHYDVMVGGIGDQDSMQDLAAAVLAGLPDGPFNVAGLSMGGIVAMEMVRQAGPRVRRLALLDTNHRAESAERRCTRDKQIEKVRAGNLRAVIVEEMKPNYLAAANRGNQALLDLLVNMALSLGADTFIRQSLALRNRDDYTAVLASYEGVALVLHGAEDHLCPPQRHGEMAALLKDVRLVSVPGSGHISTLENPIAVNAALGRWLAVPR